MTLFALALACHQSPEGHGPGPTVPTNPQDTDIPTPTGITGITGSTGDTGEYVPPPPTGLAPRTGGDVSAYGTLTYSLVPWYPDADDMAITDSGGLCLSGGSWYYGYGSTSVDQYVVGDALMTRVDASGGRDLGFGLFQAKGTMGGTAVAAGPSDSCYLAVGLDAGGGYYDADAAGVFRVTASGSPDPAFALVQLDHGAGPEQVLAMVGLADGGVMVLGTSRNAAYVARYDVDGVPDPTWGGAGEVQLPVAVDCENTSACRWGGLVVQPDGSVFAGIGAPGAVTKLDSAGAVDSAYGIGGVATTSGSFEAAAMAVDADGGVIVGGSVTSGRDTAPWVEGLDPDGQPALAATEIQVPRSGNYVYVRVSGVAVDDQHRILLATSGPTVWRLGSDGVLDPSFGTGGAFEAGSNGTFNRVRIAPNGTVVAAGEGDDEKVVVVALTP